MICSGTKAKVQGYIEDVLSGDIVVNKLVRMAVQRHVNDLDKQRTDEFPYYFNECHAETFCDFFPIMLRHSTGRFKGMPFELEPWQAFGVWVLFGWKRVLDDSRRFRRFFWSMGRKNGKSCIGAGIAILCAMFDINPMTGEPESVAEVVLCAPKKAQAEDVVYAEILRMRDVSDSIRKSSTDINRQVRFFHNDGVIKCIGSDRPFSGLNPSLVVMDETHEWKEHNRRFYDTMLTGSISRVQPLIGSVTTAGDEQSHIWQGEYDLSYATLYDITRNDTFFAYVFELDEADDPLDESNWIKANPNLGVSFEINTLREMPKESKIDLNRFVRYHCNRKVTALSRAFEIATWDQAEGTLSDWKNADCIGYGVDLGSKDDLSAWAAVARFPVIGSQPNSDDDKSIWRYEIVCSTYMDAGTNRNIKKNPFDEWCRQDLIKVRDYPNVELEADLKRHHDKHYGGEIAFDANNAKVLIEMLTKDGYTPFTMRQTQSYFNEPIRDFLQALRSGRITHNGDPVLRWCVSNAVLKTTAQEEIMFDKSSSNDKIDAVVAVVMAFRVVSRSQSRVQGSLYL